MITANCIERCSSNKKAVDALDSFNEKFYDYLNRAVAGENPYELEIDKRWANFIYKSSKMTFMKVIVILIAIAPSFTKFVSVFTTPLSITGCYVGNDPNNTLVLGDCIKYNQNSPSVKFVGGNRVDKSIPFIAAYTFVFLLPHLVFLGILWLRFNVNKYTFWISSARIHLTTYHKRVLACSYYYLMVSMIIIIYANSEGMMDFNKKWGEEGYLVPYNNQTNLTLTFQKSDSNSTLVLLSSGLIYSCLLTVLFAQTRQPTSFFVGFREYMKEASRVPYNTATVDYRIERDAITRKFIERYYQECERYDRRIVLIAMVTHFLDLEILEVEGAENDKSSVSIEINE